MTEKKREKERVIEKKRDKKSMRVREKRKRDRKEERVWREGERSVRGEKEKILQRLRRFCR